MPKGGGGPEAHYKPMRDTFLVVWIAVLILISCPLFYFLGYWQGYANGKNIIYENYTVTERIPPINLGSGPRR